LTSKRIVLLGSTGSIGRQTLEVVESFPDRLKVEVLVAGSNADLLVEQARKFRPSLVAVAEPAAYGQLRRELEPLGIKVLAGADEVERAAAEPADIAVSAISGIAGLKPTLAAIRSGKTVALSNKESLVAGGHLVMQEAARQGVDILPVDSEHSAIWQCLQGNRRVKKIILTASGGPFRGRSRGELREVGPEQALKHPNWDMGAKVTIDSATLMNKGLEVIEAKWLFGLDVSQVDVVVHPQSIVHSMVEFIDGAVLAQMGVPDMRLPIQFALSYPDRWPAGWPVLSLAEVGNLTFEPPDRATFPAINLAYQAAEAGGTMPTVMNGANEVAVSLFLSHRIGFLRIPEIIKRTMEDHVPIADPSLKDVLEADRWSRERTIECVNQGTERGASTS